MEGKKIVLLQGWKFANLFLQRADGVFFFSFPFFLDSSSSRFFRLVLFCWGSHPPFLSSSQFQELGPLPSVRWSRKRRNFRIISPAAPSFLLPRGGYSCLVRWSSFSASVLFFFLFPAVAAFSEFLGYLPFRSPKGREVPLHGKYKGSTLFPHI